MSTSFVVGVPVPKMLPVTGTWTLPFAAYLLLLSNRIVYQRVKNDKYVGDRLDNNAPNDAPDPLLIESRCHANFLESVPMAFILTAVAELNGANRKVLNYALATLFALRVVHAEFGLKGKNAHALGRPVGFFGTQGFLGGMAAYGAYLVKGYWY